MDEISIHSSPDRSSADTRESFVGSKESFIGPREAKNTLDEISVQNSPNGPSGDARESSADSREVLSGGCTGVLTISRVTLLRLAAIAFFTILSLALIAFTGMLCPVDDYEIYLSYCKEDHKLATNLHHGLDLYRLDVFFDEVSLPLGHPYGEVMMAAAAKCSVGLLVLSEEFFSTDWPMLEAHIFLQSKESGYRREMKIVPLYFKVSRSDLQNEEKRKQWFSAWCRTRPKDSRSTEVKEQEWTAIVEGLINTSGIGFEDSSDEAATIHKVVERVGSIARQHVRVDSEQPRRMEIDDRMLELIPILRQLNAGSARQPLVRTWFSDLSDLLCSCSRLAKGRLGKVIINNVWALYKAIINIALAQD